MKHREEEELTEEELTEDEWAQWHTLRSKIWRDHDRKFQAFLEAAVKTEQEAYTARRVGLSNAFVQLRRAQIQAWKTYEGI